MSEPRDYLRSGFIRSFKDIVERVDPHELVLELIQRRILPISELDQRCNDKREERMMRLLGRVHRQSLVDRSTLVEFVDALDQINTKDTGHKYEDIIDSFRAIERTGVPDDFRCEYLPFSEIERLVFDCTRRVAEKSLELDSLLPALVSRHVISMEAFDEVLDQKERLNQVHLLLETIERNGSRAFDAFVQILLDSDDRSAIGVGNMMQECLEAQKESPYTPSEWLGRRFAYQVFSN